MDKKAITQKARKLWQNYEERNPRRLCAYLDIRIIDLPMGKEPDSIKGLISKDSRCYSIVVNSDLPEKEQEFILFHEIGHYCLGHADESICAYRDINYQTSTQEIEANEFIAEYLLDTEETLSVLQETNSFYATASIMQVPAAIMDFKWRMLKYYNLVSADAPIYSDSDCMGHLNFNADVDYDDCLEN